MTETPTHIITPPNWTDKLNLSDYFDTSKPLDVDVGCGKGRLLLALAAKSPDRNFIGIDRQLARLRVIDKRINGRSIQNTKLLRIENSYAIQYLLAPKSVSTFYVFFPDPWPKKRHHKRRMFNAEFLETLTARLTDDGKIHVTTDHLQYFEEMESLLKNDKRFKEIETFVTDDDEKTNFELIFLKQNLPIGRCAGRRRCRYQSAGFRSPQPVRLRRQRPARSR